jgi:hypothetical protein
VIERIWCVFKSQFRIFKLAPPFPFKAQVELVVACTTLHNFLCKECHYDEFPVKPIDESSSSCCQIMKKIIMNPLFKQKSRNEKMVINGGLVYVQICGKMLLRQ